MPEAGSAPKTQQLFSTSTGADQSLLLCLPRFTVTVCLRSQHQVSRRFLLEHERRGLAHGHLGRVDCHRLRPDRLHQEVHQVSPSRQKTRYFRHSGGSWYLSLKVFRFLSMPIQEKDFDPSEIYQSVRLKILHCVFQFQFKMFSPREQIMKKWQVFDTLLDNSWKV